MTRTLPRRDFLKACKKLSAGQTIQPDALSVMGGDWLSACEHCARAGSVLTRGGMLDVWTPAEKLPVRLDFFGDEIETIRKFDPASQSTIEKLESILITPAREFIAVAHGDQTMRII